MISGHKAAIERALEIAKEKGAKRAILLPVSAPFHCPLMQPAAEAMAQALAGAAMEPPAVSLYANVTAAPVDSPDTIRELLVEQVTGMVRWRESVAKMAAAGVTHFVEFGGKVLGPMVKRIAPDVEVTSVVSAGGHRRAGRRDLSLSYRPAADGGGARTGRSGRSIEPCDQGDCMRRVARTHVAGGQRDDVVEADRLAEVAGERLGERAVAAARAGAVEGDIGGIGREDDPDLAALQRERRAAGPGSPPARREARPCRRSGCGRHSRPGPGSCGTGGVRSWQRRHCRSGLLRQASRNRTVTPARCWSNWTSVCRLRKDVAALQQQQILAANLHAVAGDVEQGDRVGVDRAQIGGDPRHRLRRTAVDLHRDRVEAQLLEAARHQGRVAAGVGERVGRASSGSSG